MTNKQANAAGTSIMLLVAFIIICLVMYNSYTSQDTTQKQHNFQVGDDTEHIWIGGDGDTIWE